MRVNFDGNSDQSHIKIRVCTGPGWVQPGIFSGSIPGPDWNFRFCPGVKLTFCILISAIAPVLASAPAIFRRRFAGGLSKKFRRRCRRFAGGSEEKNPPASSTPAVRQGVFQNRRRGSAGAAGGSPGGLRVRNFLPAVQSAILIWVKIMFPNTELSL